MVLNQSRLDTSMTSSTELLIIFGHNIMTNLQFPNRGVIKKFHGNKSEKNDSSMNEMLIVSLFEIPIEWKILSHKIDLEF